MVTTLADPPKQQVDLTNAINQLCTGMSADVALNALLTNVAWIVAEGIEKYPEKHDQMLDMICAELRQAIKIQLQEEKDGG